MPLAEDQYRLVTSVRALSTTLSAWAFARKLRGGIFTASMPAQDTRSASKDAVNCPARSPTGWISRSSVHARLGGWTWVRL
jgi:hypothetical protein